MLKNDKLIHRLTFDEKVSLIVSFNLNETSKVENYNFPSYKLMNNPLDETDCTSTNFPSIKGLSFSFNDELIEKVSNKIQEEKNIFSSNPFVQFSNIPNVDCLSDDAYVNGKILQSYFKGIKNSYSSGIYLKESLSDDVTIDKEISSLTDYYVLNEDLADYIVINSLEQKSILEQLYKGKYKYFAKTSSINELVRFINSGIIQIFFDGKKEDVIEILKKAEKRFNTLFQELKNGIISQDVFDREYQKGTILDINQLNKASDDYVSLLLSLEKDKENSIAESTFMKDNTKYYFDASGNSELSYNASKEGVVLLKNENDVLPIRLNKKIAVVGDSFKNQDYFDNEFNHKSVLYKTPNDLMKDYLELDCLGFAHGYLKDKPISGELINSAKELIDKADVLLYYMESDKKTKSIPEEQIKVLYELKEHKNIKTVVVLNTNFYVDIPFIDVIDGLILSHSLGDQAPKAVLDVITGEVNPSGKLSSSYPVLNTFGNNNSIYPINYLDTPLLFPFGYGLSYSNFTYSNITVDDDGVTFSVTNNSNIDGYQTSFLFIQKENSIHSLKNKSLRGYTKTFIKANSTERVTILFDAKTFDFYDNLNHSFGIEGGEYIVSIGSDFNNIHLKGTIKLGKYLTKEFMVDDADYISPRLKKKDLDSKAQILKDYNRTLKHLLSIVIGLFLGVVTYLFISYLFYDNYFGDPLTSYNIGTAIMIVVDISIILFEIIYNVKVGKEFKKLLTEYAKEELSLYEMVDTVPVFKSSERTITRKENDTKDILKVSLEEENDNPVFFKDEIVEVKKEDIIKEKETEEYMEVDLSVEKEEEKEDLINIDDATLSQEEINAHEEELKNNVLMDSNMDFNELEVPMNFNNEQSISQVVENLINFSLSRGIILELSTARSIISSIASNHIIFIDSKQKNLLPKFAQIINDFFMSPGHVFTEQPFFNSPFYLVWEKNENGDYQKTQFINDIYNAARFKETLNITTLSDVSMANLPLYFKDFIDYSISPTKDHYIKLNNTQSLKIPANITFLIIPKESNFLDIMDNRLRKISSFVNCVIREALDGENTLVNQKDPISYSYFKDVINEAKASFYLPENLWKKMDDFEDKLNEKDHFVIDNKLQLSLEAFLSIYMDLGGDEIDALDSLLVSKIFIILKGLSISKENNSAKLMSDLIESTFTEDYSQKVKRVIKEFDFSSLEEEIIDNSNAESKEEIKEESKEEIIKDDKKENE